jgi:hypothetical protein
MDSNTLAVMKVTLDVEIHYQYIHIYTVHVYGYYKMVISYIFSVQFK